MTSAMCVDTKKCFFLY